MKFRETDSQKEIIVQSVPVISLIVPGVVEGNLRNLFPTFKNGVYLWEVKLLKLLV